MGWVSAEGGVVCCQLEGGGAVGAALESRLVGETPISGAALELWPFKLWSG